MKPIRRLNEFRPTPIEKTTTNDALQWWQAVRPVYRMALHYANKAEITDDTALKAYNQLTDGLMQVYNTPYPQEMEELQARLAQVVLDVIAGYSSYFMRDAHRSQQDRQRAMEGIRIFQEALKKTTIRSH